MVNNQQKQLDLIFQALSDSTRRDMIERLAKGEYAASQLAEKYKMSFPAVSKHLRVLKQAGLVKDQYKGRNHIFMVNAAQLNNAREWMEHWSKYWNSILNNLDKFLANH